MFLMCVLLILCIIDFVYSLHKLLGTISYNFVCKSVPTIIIETYISSNALFWSHKTMDLDLHYFIKLKGHLIRLWFIDSWYICFVGSAMSRLISYFYLSDNQLNMN